MNSLYEKKIIFVGGKGGVGKSTSSAALAVAFADQGFRTLVVSTDPAHNLGDIFHQTVHGEITELIENLWGIEIDPQQEANRYIKGVKENLEGLVKSKMVEEVHRQIDMASASPGADEAALFDRLISIILEQYDQFDKIVFDTAPTGHTVRLLTLPELMGVWIDGMLERRKKINHNYTELLNDGDPIDDPIYSILQKRKDKFSEVRKIILDQNQTGFVFVLIPERLPILETNKAIRQLETHHIHVHTLIVNKVLPDYADGIFLEKRREQERVYLREMEQTFKNQEFIHIPLFEEDVSNMEKLRQFSNNFTSSIKSM